MAQTDEDQKRCYSCHSFYSLNNFAKQLAACNRRSNNFPIKPQADFLLLSLLSNMFDKPAKEKNENEVVTRRGGLW